jgi:hypothetical protein
VCRHGGHITLVFYSLLLLLAIHESYSLVASLIVRLRTASVVQWSEFIVTDPEVPGSIPWP